MTEAVVARLESVSHRYGATVALDDVTIEIPARKMVAVIGPDGVGKSTLLALISGVRTIQSGQISVFDGNLANASHLKTLRTRIAYMPQGLGRNLYPSLSVFENIDFFGRLFGQSLGCRQARITELLTATGLNSFEKRPAGKLSGGMKQKLSLCCALINDPDLLILDEPTTGVDPLSRGQFWDLINTIRARRPQMSVMVATAYMDEAQRFDWLVAMDDGKIIAHGRLQELLDKAGEPTLEGAFIALLPQQKRALHQKVIVRPRPASTDEIAIEAEGLTRRFGDFVAVDHVNFKIGRGEIFGFLGSNGCGKSTTMKMLTGFLPATEGWAKLFGKPMSANDMEMRRNVGYMTQAFSLYGELTVRQNLELHAQLYHLPPNKIEGRVQELLNRYDLTGVVNAKPASLPLGIKQRLQLAVAVLHEPAILILDEPTSGVDPIARDAFWRTLIDLSRNDGVTIFLSTHFMNEAERCDRISLMHAGKVLAVGAPLDLVKERGSNSLEDTFIGYLAEAAGIDRSKKVEASRPAVAPIEEGQLTRAPKWFDLTRLWAYARRETLELLRDPIRLAFAILGPIILMAAFGYGISFDIENLQTAAFDQDNTPQSRRLLDGFAGSQYFAVQPPIRSAAEADQRLRSGNTQIVIEIPSGFGRDLLNGMRPEVDATVDGAMTFRGETARSYVNATIKKQGQELQRDVRRPRSPNAWSDDNIESRYRYNQAFLSVNAMVPSVFMLMLCLIPAIMSAISVVREKETGSIANFRSTPITKFEFLLGKQLPYVGVAMVNFAFLFLMAIFVFDVPLKGPFFTLLIGTVIYVISTTGFGQLISSFTRTQVAAVFATAILSIVPAVNFSGIFAPVSSLSGGAKILGLTFPSAWYQPITVGVFAKALGMLDLWRNVAAISVIALVFFALSLMFLRKQET